MKSDLQKLKIHLLSQRSYVKHHLKKNVALDVANMVEESRTIYRLTQAQLAKKCGMKQSSIARIENGHLPSLRTLEKITKALDMTFIILV